MMEVKLSNFALSPFFSLGIEIRKPLGTAALLYKPRQCWMLIWPNLFYSRANAESRTP
jgi:hypothetical protein